MPSATPKNVPSPPSSSTFTGMIAQPKASPAMPMPLLVASAMVEATCVPWNSSSFGMLVVVDEVVAGQELRVAPVGGLAEGLAGARVGVVLVGDAAVEHRHRHRGLALLDPPGPLGVHLGEVPLEASRSGRRA